MCPFSFFLLSSETYWWCPCWVWFVVLRHLFRTAEFDTEQGRRSLPHTHMHFSRRFSRCNARHSFSLRQTLSDDSKMVNISIAGRSTERKMEKECPDGWANEAMSANDSKMKCLATESNPERMDWETKDSSEPIDDTDKERSSGLIDEKTSGEFSMLFDWSRPSSLSGQSLRDLR